MKRIKDNVMPPLGGNETSSCSAFEQALAQMLCERYIITFTGGSDGVSASAASYVNSRLAKAYFGRGRDHREALTNLLLDAFRKASKTK